MEAIEARYNAPIADILKTKLDKGNFSSVSRELGVSRYAIREWAKRVGIIPQGRVRSVA